MKRTTISEMEPREILRFVSETIIKEESRLNALDAAIGDGDHGHTARVGFQAIRKSIDNTPNGTDISTILGNTGRAFMDATGGAIILGRMLICGEEALKGRETLGADELKRWLDAMESTITVVGKAKPGTRPSWMPCMPLTLRFQRRSYRGMTLLRRSWQPAKQPTAVRVTRQACSVRSAELADWAIESWVTQTPVQSPSRLL